MKKQDYADFQRWKDFTLDEFKKEIDIGMDINFFIGDDLFWIGGVDNETCAIAQCPEGDAVVFKDADDMLDHFVYKGKTLREHFPDIEFTNA